jgi:hypothetical protein
MRLRMNGAPKMLVVREFQTSSCLAILTTTYYRGSVYYDDIKLEAWQEY